LDALGIFDRLNVLVYIVEQRDVELRAPLEQVGLGADLERVESFRRIRRIGAIR